MDWTIAFLIQYFVKRNQGNQNGTSRCQTEADTSDWQTNFIVKSPSNGRMAAMSHSVHRKGKLLQSLRNSRGRAFHIARGIETDAVCAPVHRMGRISPRDQEWIIGRPIARPLSAYLVDVDAHKQTLMAEAAQQLLDIVHSCFK